MTQDNDAPKTADEAFARLAKALEDHVRKSQEERAEKERLAKENDDLKGKQTETQKALDAEKAGRKQDEEKTMTNIGRLLQVLGALAVAGFFIWVGSNISFGPNNRQQVAGGKLEKIEQAVVESRKDSKDAKAAAENLLGNVQTLAAAVGRIAAGDKTGTASTDIASIENWSDLSAGGKVKVYTKACGNEKINTFSADDNNAFQVGLVHTSPIDANLLVQKCDHRSFIAKGKSVMATYANNTDDPNAAEDAAAELEQPARVQQVQYAPNPWIQPVHTRPGLICNRPGCNQPGHVHGRGRLTCGPGKRWSEEFQACASGRKTAGMHRYDEYNAGCRPGEVRVKEVPIPGGVRRIHQTCR